MNEQRIREIVREEITKEKGAAAVTTPDEMRKVMRDAAGLPNDATAKQCIPCNITFDEPHPDDRYCPYCASELTENDNKKFEEAAAETATSDPLTKELLRRRETEEDCTDVIQEMIDQSSTKV